MTVKFLHHLCSNNASTCVIGVSNLRENCKKPPQLEVKLQKTTGFHQIRKSPPLFVDSVAKNHQFPRNLVLAELTIILTSMAHCQA